MQHLSRENCGVLFAVNPVAQNWVAKMLKMNPHLVCPAAVQFAFDQARLIR